MWGSTWKISLTDSGWPNSSMDTLWTQILQQSTPSMKRDQARWASYGNLWDFLAATGSSRIPPLYRYRSNHLVGTSPASLEKWTGTARGALAHQPHHYRTTTAAETNSLRSYLTCWWSLKHVRDLRIWNDCLSPVTGSCSTPVST